MHLLRNFIILILLVIFHCSPSFAQEATAEWVEPKNNIVLCFQSSKGWLFNTTGSCQTFIRSDTIALGQPFKVEGQTIQIGYIAVLTVDGEIKGCSAASSRGQIPLDDTLADRIWLFIEQCIVVK